MNLETAVERARAGRDAVRLQGATKVDAESTQACTARARNEAQPCQRAAARSARVRIVLTQEVRPVLSADAKDHAA